MKVCQVAKISCAASGITLKHTGWLDKCYVCPTLHSPILGIIVLLVIILWQSTTSTIFQGDDKHDHVDNSISNVVNNGRNCLYDTSESNESSPFLKGISTHEDSKVFFIGQNWMDVSSTTIHPRTRLGSYLIIQMTFLSLLNSRYHHHANWTWVHMSLSSCCS